MTGPQQSRVLCKDERDSACLAWDIASYVQPGDIIALSGHLGAGKTVLAREIIRYLAGTADLEVPSPTFAILIEYPLPHLQMTHADLYRIESATEVSELGLDEVLPYGALIVEWPQLLDPGLSKNRLDVAIAGEGESRSIDLTGRGSWAARLTRLLVARRILADAGMARARREHVTGDVSGRSYRRIGSDPRSAILMDAPDRSDGPAIFKGRSFEQATHRAMDSRNFAAVASFLHEIGLHPPEFYTADIANGVFLLEDLGSQGIVDANGDPIGECYETAIDVLLHLHAAAPPSRLPVSGTAPIVLPRYDLDAYLAELTLFPDWYTGTESTDAMSPGDRSRFLDSWSEILRPLCEVHDSLVLLDYHSPNLMWLADAAGLMRIGLLDFQDALLGHAAYDVASLVQDARVGIPVQLQDHLLQRYLLARQASDPDFAVEEFTTAVAIFGAQRATKVLGAFARLKQQGKTGYAAHFGNLIRNLKRNLTHPNLEPIRSSYEPYI